MSGNIVERLEREIVDGEKESATYVYKVTGTLDEMEVGNLVAVQCPNTYQTRAGNTLPRRELRMKESGWKIWECTVLYGQADSQDTDAFSYDFDTGGGQQKITQSLETINRYAPAGRTAANHLGSIGVTKDSIEGVEIVVPIYKWSERRKMFASQITNAYKATLFGLTGQVNDSSFRGFSAGEVLFEGAQGSQRGLELWDMTFKFSASPNVTDLSVGGITDIDKDGWDYLWFEYEESVDATAGRMIRTAVGAYVERVYARGNFSTMNIGV